MESRVGSSTIEHVRQEFFLPDSEETGAERRVEGRFATDDVARMRVLQPVPGRATEVRVLDISRGGFKLHIPEMLPPGTIVQVQVKSAIVLAEIRYCVRTEEGFFAGLRFQDVFWMHEQKA